jgi:acyl-coenzyme A synthetase/AMP-(fatty) acid ligase
MLSGLGHDPIQRDIFGPLCNGACLVIPPADVFAPHLLARWLKQNAISFVHMTPAMAQILCTTEETEFESLRITFLTGEKLHSDVVARLQRYNAKMRILNSYGTTETQRAVTYFEASARPHLRGVVPAGEFAPDAVIRVLNATGNLCGVGEVGEIFIESYHLSKGYRNDAELTRKVMTELGGGRRRYRTGDVGCRLPGDTVMCLGRKDGQINVRGFRIETGEIESHIRSADKIKDAVVLAVARKPDGETALVAYVVPNFLVQDMRALKADVMTRLKAGLPAYMVPSSIMMLDALPLTPNGKLDRRALPEPTWSDDAAYVAPRTGLETALASIWGDILRVDKVGIQDNFFDLGGHSVLLLLLITQMRKRLQMEFSLTEMLPCTTIREQADVLSRATA